MFNPQPRPRTWGFKFLPTDTLALVGFGGGALGFHWLGSPLSWILLIAVGHFFLFCNVFRIIRRRELIWASLFLLNIALWTWFGRLTCLPVLLSQLPITAGLILADIRSPGYHGIFANRLNPRLKDYLAQGTPTRKCNREFSKNHGKSM